MKHTLSAEENSELSHIDNTINDYLKRVRNATNASRVALVRFHNGGKDMNGLSFLKMSMTNETIQSGLAPLMPDFRNIFRSFYSYWCERLIIEGHCYIDDVEKLKDVDPTMYEFLQSRGIVAIYGIPIVNKNESVIGFIYIEYVHNKDINKEQVLSCLDDKKLKIEVLLNK